MVSGEKAFLEFRLQGTSGLQFVRNIGTNTAVNVKVYKLLLGTMMPGEKIEIKLLPVSSSYELFIIEYQNISGHTYQTVLKPQNGRGDHEFLFVPRKIRLRRHQLEGIFKSKDISLPRYIRKIYFPKK